MQIKNVEISDKDTFKQTYITALKQGFSDYDFIPTNSLNQFENDFDTYFNEIFSNPKMQMFLCYENNQPAGIMVCGKSDLDNALNDDAILDSIYFKKEYYGKGLAKSALDFAQNYLSNSGYNRIVLWCSTENKRAWRFYEKNGFTTTDQQWNDVLDGKTYHNILLTKNI